jgi:hypothetical protein
LNQFVIPIENINAPMKIGVINCPVAYDGLLLFFDPASGGNRQKYKN